MNHIEEMNDDKGDDKKWNNTNTKKRRENFLKNKSLNSYFQIFSSAITYSIETKVLLYLNLLYGIDRGTGCS
jgi:hypothetical protein